jgi:hypothetical protein
MKTGRLLKFKRPGGEIQAYLYQEGALFRAAVYVMSGEPRERREPVHTFHAASQAAVEKDVRAWVDERYPGKR